MRHSVSMWIGVAALVAGSRVATAQSGRPLPGAVTAERLKLPSAPSSVRGLADEPSVDPFYAQLDYQVPIDLPGGHGGLAPSLALTYAGTLGNGPIGIGWTLAQPRIQRATRRGVPAFDDSDELELSGIAPGRLVSIGNGEYRVEGRGQTVRVRRVDGGFEIDDGSGVRSRLGTSAATRQERDASHTLAWLVDSQTNGMGEQIRYAYTRDQNQVYLTAITWGPNDAYRVTLDYEARNDQTRSYRGGFSVVTAKRLATISVAAFGVERRSYQLSYGAGFSLARLSGVTSNGVGGAGSWPALSFAYASPAAPAKQQITGAGDWRLNDNGTTLVDLDGDGAAELLQLAGGGHSYLTNRNGAFSGLQPMTGNTQPLSQVQLQDIDGDARAELLVDSSGGWVVYKFTRTRWVAQPGTWPGTAGVPLKQPATARFADLDGDGLVDAIQWNNDGLRIRMATPTGLLAETAEPRIGGTVLPTLDGRFHDINGDGLDDYTLIASDHLETYLGRGDGTFEPMAIIGYPFGGSIASSQDIELADLDRDGLVDLLRIDVGNVQWYRGRPDGTFAAQVVTLDNPTPLSSSVVVAVADTNGNGSQDVVWSSPAGMWRMDLAGTTTAGMLVEVSNGLGMDVGFSYESSHALAVKASPAWTSSVPIAIPVPVHKTTALGPGETVREISYSVRDGFWDAAEQRFGGFLSTVVTTSGATAAQTSTVMVSYHKGVGVNRVLRGLPLTTQTFDGTGKRLQLVTDTWTAMTVAGLPDSPLLRRAARTHSHTRFEDAPSLRETDQSYEFDPLVRLERSVDLGRTDLTGDESVTEWVYGDDATTWVRDRLCEHKVTTIGGAVLRHDQTLYGDDQAVLPLCAIGKGWPRETRAWLGSENRFVTQSQTRYDAHGNPVALIQAGVERRLAYDADALFPIEERIAAPRGDLIWQASWDRVLGEPQAVIDPNGHTAHLGHDSLGRFTGASIDDLPPHQVIEYDWTAPFPKTTTWTFDGALADVTAVPATWSAAGHWRQTVEVANGKGGTRYRALRLGDAQWIVTDYHEVDPNGRVVFAGRPVLSAQLELSARPSAVVGDALAYDPLGRLIEQTLPTGAKRTYSYVSFERTMQEANLAPVHEVLDGQGRAITTERSLPGGAHEIVQASYDAAGQLTQMTLSGGAVTRSFGYDTLGRLTTSQDPDLGVRTLSWDDGNRLATETNAVGQVVHYSYDALGRLDTLDRGAVFHYHYDDARPGAAGPLGNLVGRLAWVDEPTGGVDFGYDALGRASFSRRRIDPQVSEATTAYTASGLVLGKSYDDGFAFSYQYDPAARLIGAGDLWQALELDAAGQPLHERTHSGVDTRIARDALGLPSELTVRDADGVDLYHVAATRNAWAAITALTDLDGRGLDHTATFGYDDFARLTSATLGTGAQAFGFGYSYDALHNMTARTATGPRPLGVLAGDYHAGEAGRGPRQLTSITGAGGAVLHSFDYDAAGRQIAEDGRTLTFDAFDHLLRVDGLPGGAIEHAYGQDGERVRTIAPGGAIAYLFGDGTALRGGVREHDIAIGSRVVARVTLPAAGSAVAEPALGALGTGAPWGLALGGLVLVIIARTPRTRRRAAAVGMIGVALSTSCTGAGSGTGALQRSTLASSATYLHTGFGAGPTVFTDATGHLLEERRFEPFGAPIDALIHGAGGDAIGDPDLLARDLNELNKRVDTATGWSDHGARWMAPETGRWLSADPLVTGPDAAFMRAPWALHPYHYAGQNPVVYWDPDGREPAAVDPTVWGRSAVCDGKAVGPYGNLTANYNVDGNLVGVQGGFGLVNGPLHPGIDLAINVDAGIGKFTDSSGAVNYGVDLNANAVKINLAHGPAALDGGFVNIDAGAYVNKNFASIGAQVNNADAAFTLGNGHHSIRGGVSLGVGLAERWHYADSDNNGIREIGFGFDFGIIEFDARTEALGRLQNFVSGGPIDRTVLDSVDWNSDGSPGPAQLRRALEPTISPELEVHTRALLRAVVP